MIIATTEIVSLSIWLAVLLLAVLHSGLFSGLETGVYTLNKVRLSLRAQQGRADAKRLESLLAQPNKLLATILIGTNISGYAASFAISAIFILAGAGPWSHWLTIAVATPLMFIAGESVPKNVFRKMAEKLTYKQAWILSAAKIVFATLLIGPVVRGFAALTTKILSPGNDNSPFGNVGITAALIDSQASGVLTRSQLAMASRVINLPEVTIARAMVPMDKVISGPQNITRPQLKKLFSTHSVSRIPLISKSGKVAGILDMYRVLSDPSDRKPLSYMHDILSFPQATTISDALLQMRRANEVIAKVTKSDTCIGIITLKDLVEEIVGEIEAW